MTFSNKMFSRRTTALCLAALCLSLLLPTATRAAGPVSLPDHRGTTLVLPASPQRIVSLLPSLTESVCALGGCTRLVGVDRFSNSPPQVSSLPKLGSLDDTQIERIVLLKPDVVLVAPSSRVTDRLEQLGLKVLVIESNTHADVRRSLDTLGHLLGAPAEAVRVWAHIEQEMTAAAARVPPALRGQRVYFEIDGSGYAAGHASFIGQTLTRLGMGNVVGPELGPFPKLNPEFVVRGQPDIVMAAQRNLDAMPGRPGWGVLRALQSGRSCGFASERYELLIRPGPRMGEAAQLLADCLAGLPPATPVAR
jgi:iron complex transport system substrate-binding protein